MLIWGSCFWLLSRPCQTTIVFTVKRCGWVSDGIVMILKIMHVIKYHSKIERLWNWYFNSIMPLGFLTEYLYQLHVRTYVFLFLFTFNIIRQHCYDLIWEQHDDCYYTRHTNQPTYIHTCYAEWNTELNCSVYRQTETISTSVCPFLFPFGMRTKKCLEWN